MPLSAAQLLQNRYRIDAALIRGGVGTVNWCWDLWLNTPVALKQMTPQSGLDSLGLLQLEAQFE